MSKEILTEKLNKTISYKYRQLFVEDIICDSDKDFEVLDYDEIKVICYDGKSFNEPDIVIDKDINGNSIKQFQVNIVDNFNEQIVENILVEAFKYCSNTKIKDIDYCKFVFDKNTDINKIEKILDKEYNTDLHFMRDGVIANVIFMDLSDKNVGYAIPVNGYFGVITINNKGIGVCCLPERIVKIELDKV